MTAVSLPVLLAACGGGSSDLASEAVSSVSADIGASGGTLDLQSLALTLPPGAVPTAAKLSMASLAAGTGEIARFRLDPPGLALDTPAELRFTRSGMPATTRFFWEVNGELQLIPSSLNGDVLTAQINSLGLSAAGSVLRAQSAALPARARAQADAPTEGGTVVVKPMDCATQIPQMAARLNIVAAGRDQEIVIRFHDELVAAKELCLEAEVQALKDSSCQALGTALFKAQTVLADSFVTFQELTLPLLSAEAFVQQTGATCATEDSTQVSPLIAGKFEQILQVLQSQQLRGGFAEEATARDLQVLLSYKGSCDQLDLGTICDRLNDEIIPNLFDGMRVGAFNECRSSGSALVLSQLHFLGTSVTDTSKFLGFGRFGPVDVEADMTYCTDPSLNLRVFSDAAGIPTELTDRAATLRPLVGLGNYPRSTTVAVPRDGSLTVSGEVAALRCADGGASPADLVVRIGNREVARRSVGSNGYPLTTAPLDLVMSQLLANAGLDTAATNAFTVLINREGGQCLGALGPTLNGDRTLFEIRVNLPAMPPSRFELVAKAGGGQHEKTECVKDTQTGLMWEGKPLSGSRAATNLYTNFANAAQAPGLGVDAVTSGSNSLGYVNHVNGLALCGHADWRIPTREELATLRSTTDDTARPYVVDREWHPNIRDGYWSVSDYFGSAHRADLWLFYAWTVNYVNVLPVFDDLDRASSAPLRLVR